MVFARTVLGYLSVGGVISMMSQPISFGQMPNRAANCLPSEAITETHVGSILRPKAVQLDLRQQLRLAGNYYAGRGVTKDYAQSAFWYRKAADQGDPGAQVELGYFYLHGIGVDLDAAQAAQWFERAAGSGSRQAKLNLAMLFLKGTGVRRDTVVANRLLRELATQNDARAASYLGIMYMLGIGVEKDMAFAERLFEIAARQHSPEAEYSMGTLYSVTDGHPKDIQKAAKFLRQSAAQGYVPGMHSLGLLLVRHPVLRPSKGEAVRWLAEAATGGSWRSTIVLGVLARDGVGRPKDLIEAYRWFVIASRQGGSEAQELLRKEVANVRDSLGEAERTAGEKGATNWLYEHPHKDVYKIPRGLQNSYYPADEVYSDEISEVESAKGASTD